MFTNDEKRIINEIMNSPSKEKLVMELMRIYASESVENARQLLNHSKNIVDIIIKKMLEENTKTRNAAYMLMCQPYMEADKSSMFASMVPVCMVMFPNGVKEDQSSFAGMDYFEKFLSLLADKKVFSMKDKDDANWARCFGYEDYLNLVIDKNFKK